MTSFRSLRFALALCGALMLNQAAQAQFPAPSPAGTVKQRVGLTDVEINYSRPGVKDRTIFGGLVPYGKVWRTGANAATNISFSTPITIEGKELPAGKYGIYTIPGKDEWTVIFSNDSDAWGSYRYDESKDVLRVKVKPESLKEKVETFTIDINDIRDESATLNLIWENTKVPVELGIHIVDEVVARIDKAMSSEGGRKPYFQAAGFYYEHGLDIAKAREWVDAAVAENPDAFYMHHLRAKILAKQGEKKAAIEAAQKSMELAKKAGDNGYIQQNEQLIASLR